MTSKGLRLNVSKTKVPNINQCDHCPSVEGIVFGHVLYARRVCVATVSSVLCAATGSTKGTLVQWLISNTYTPFKFIFSECNGN